VVTESRKAVHDPEISYAERLFRLRIRDAGEGIATAILEDGRPAHYGLRGMREPAAEIGEAGYLERYGGRHGNRLARSRLD